MTILYDSTIYPNSFIDLNLYNQGDWWGGSIEGNVDGPLSSLLSSSPDGNAFIAPEYNIVRNTGNVAMLSSLTRAYDTKRWFRAEVIGQNPPYNRNLPLTVSRETYWYSFSLYPLQVDFDDSIPEIIFQIHNGGTGLPAAGGEPSLPLASPGFGISIDEGEFVIQSHASPDQLPGVTTYYSILDTLRVVPLKWYDFVIKHKIDWATPGVGDVMIWINGNLRFKQNIATGVNVSPDTYLGPYVKFGIYKRDWEDIGIVPDSSNVKTKKYIHDEIRIGDSNETYDTMKCKTPNPLLPSSNNSEMSNGSIGRF